MGKKEEVTKARRYDIVVVGAGPVGFLAVKAAGENRLNVALMGRKPDITLF